MVKQYVYSTLIVRSKYAPTTGWYGNVFMSPTVLGGIMVITVHVTTPFLCPFLLGTIFFSFTLVSFLNPCCCLVNEV